MTELNFVPQALVEKQVVCPHCWHKFYTDLALYISNHPQLFGDPVLGNHEQTRFSPKDAGKDQQGQVIDSKRWPMLERACPICHLQIPLELVEKRPRFVSIVGAGASGKTYFLTSMLHYLRGEMAKFGYSLMDSDSHDVRVFLEHEAKLFNSPNPSALTLLEKTQEGGAIYNQALLDGVPVKLPKPFIFSLRSTDTNLDAMKAGGVRRENIVWYDNAGESFDFLKDRSGSDRATHHLTECDAVLFAFDLLQNPVAREQLTQISSDPQLTSKAVTYRQETILTETINRIRKYRGMHSQEKIPFPLVVCVQKYDVWKNLMPFPTVRSAGGRSQPTIDSSSIEFVSDQGIAGLDTEELNWISLLVRSFVDDLCPEFVALAEAHFSLVRYFPVSALGISPQVEGNLLKIRPQDIQPFRVTHPMLWLLHHWRLIRRTRARANSDTRLNHAEIESVTKDRIRVISPTTRKVMMLDWQYAGTTIVDPYCGEFIWIPSIGVQPPPLTNHQPPPLPLTPGMNPLPPPIRQASGQQGIDLSHLGLDLGQPSKPNKRPWFRRS